MDFLPIALRIAQKKCLVVGGGEVAWRKISLLLQAKAKITIISPQICSQITTLITNNPTIKYLKQPFTNDIDIKPYILIFAATDQNQTNQQIAQLAKQHNILINSVDDTANCNFIMPAIINRHPMQIAINSNGKAPIISRFLRVQLEQFIPHNFGLLAQLVDKFRSQVKNHFNHNIDLCRRFWDKILTSSIPQLVFNHQHKQAEQHLQQQLTKTNKHTTQGLICLVGAGPGDPELLTIKALRLIQQADVVLYDRLVSPAIINLIRKDAQRIYVGKKNKCHTMPQQQINAELINLAQQGKLVVRLKGGDPFIFSRGGEEQQSIIDANIPLQIIPGITAASACAAYAGIPLTHRDLASSVIFISGHNKQNQTLNLPWNNLIQPQQTIVVYMAKASLPQLCQQLIQKGMKATTPIALIENATLNSQQILTGTINNIPPQQKINSPCLLIIGDVVKLRTNL